MKSIYQFILITFLTFAGTTMVRAQTDDNIHVGNDGPVIITLNEDAGSVIVGNPVNAYVVMDSPRRLMISAGVPGMTRLTIVNRTGKIILNRNLVVGAGGNGVIRIQNACINSDSGNCQIETTYKCAEGQRCSKISPSLLPAGNPSEIQGSAAQAAINTDNIEAE